MDDKKKVQNLKITERQTDSNCVRVRKSSLKNVSSLVVHDQFNNVSFIFYFILIIIKFKEELSQLGHIDNGITLFKYNNI